MAPYAPEPQRNQSISAYSPISGSEVAGPHSPKGSEVVGPHSPKGSEVVGPHSPKGSEVVGPHSPKGSEVVGPQSPRAWGGGSEVVGTFQLYMAFFVAIWQAGDGGGSLTHGVESGKRGGICEYRISSN